MTCPGHLVEGNMDAFFQRVVGEWHLIAIQAIEDHRIQPDSIEAAFHGAIDALQYRVESPIRVMVLKRSACKLSRLMLIAFTPAW